ncbi:hypothetical protein GCM10009757_11510 [Streptomyces cheonanensis]|uniref:Transposase n=1 Tax=Streptomyces cheonanensis TaxID=312720 RepID=A0ABN2UZV7_9ACTN
MDLFRPDAGILPGASASAEIADIARGKRSAAPDGTVSRLQPRLDVARWLPEERDGYRWLAAAKRPPPEAETLCSPLRRALRHAAVTTVYRKRLLRREHLRCPSRAPSCPCFRVAATRSVHRRP